MTKSEDAFRTISEVAKELGLATHVLRFWESKFPQIKPLKRAGGRRYYRPDDVALLRRLQTLLHDEGYTIKGVQKLLREDGARKFIDEGTAMVQPATPEMPSASPQAPFPEPPIKDVPLAPAGQASLFDIAPTSTPLEPDSPLPRGSIHAEISKREDLAEPEDFTTEAERPFVLPEPQQIFSPTFNSDHPFPQMPEPEPVRSPDEPEPKIIVKRMLTDTQRHMLNDILDELKDMKREIDHII